MNVRSVRVASLLVFSALAALAACGEDEAPPASDPGVCTDAGRWPRETTYGSENEDTFELPACAGHCAPNAPSTKNPSLLTSDALPYGPCTGTVACTMPVERLGPCAAGNLATGPINLFVCRCEAGAWTCRIDLRAPGGDVFGCASPDAGGADGGP